MVVKFWKNKEMSRIRQYTYDDDDVIIGNRWQDRPKYFAL